MLAINIELESVEEVPLAWLFGATGVYVLWAPKARKRPTYIGEGVLLKRLGSHVDWLGAGTTGLVGRTDLEGVSGESPGLVAKIAEHMLLRTAERINRRPTKNRNLGARRLAEGACAKTHLIRLTIRGQHPFYSPRARNSCLREKAEIRLRRQGSRFVIEDPWYRRG